MRAPFATLVVLLLGGLGPAGRSVHQIRMTSNRFTPAEVTARPGDTLRIINGNGLHNLQFVADSIPAPMAALLERAMGGGKDKLSPVGSPLLIDAGASYEFALPPLVPGRYPFVCLAHVANDMRGVLIVP